MRCRPSRIGRRRREAIDQIVAFVHGVRAEEIKRLGGDPGIVLARRLSNAEYDNTIRDLTGQDLQVARQFPVDPANTAGFDNSGETLTMSPALLNKYLQAARQIADTLVLKPDGIDFAPYSMRVESRPRKIRHPAHHRLLSGAQPTSFAEIFRGRLALSLSPGSWQPGATLASMAADIKLSAKYCPWCGASCMTRTPSARSPSCRRCGMRCPRRQRRPAPTNCASSDRSGDAKFRHPHPRPYRDAVSAPS